MESQNQRETQNCRYTSRILYRNQKRIVLEGHSERNQIERKGLGDPSMPPQFGCSNFTFGGGFFLVELLGGDCSFRVWIF